MYNTKNINKEIDKLHVVGVFDNTESIRDEIDKWLSEKLLNDKEGSFETSKQVLEFITRLGGIGYIAHIDTSDVFKEKYLSNAYRQKLFSDELLQFVGLSEYTHLDFIKSRVDEYRNEDIEFIIDNDAHDIESINTKHFWIKGVKRNFSMVKEALNDYDVSTSFVEETPNKQYIKAIFIENCEDGFLTGKEGNGNFCLNFSNALNFALI